jgi:hypothetical protein
MALAALTSAVFGSMFDASVTFRTPYLNTSLHIWRGNIGMHWFDSERPSPFRNRLRFQGKLHLPSFGNVPLFIGEPSGFIAAVPIWMAIVPLAAWITFREWRRKRAAEGKVC